MKRNRFTEEQIIGILKGGRRFGRRSVPQAWRQRRQHLQMEGEVRREEVSEATRLKALEDENTRLKRLLADAMLDNVALKDLLGKKW
jgi:putative transposase